MGLVGEAGPVGLKAGSVRRLSLLVGYIFGTGMGRALLPRLRGSHKAAPTFQGSATPFALF